MRKLLLSALFALFSLIVFAQIPNYVPANGLVGWWPFNGNANDESGNGNNGANNGATLTIDRNGVANNAYEFNSSSNNSISIGSVNLLNDFTINAWYKLNSIGGWQNIISKYGANGGYALLFDPNGVLYAHTNQGTASGDACTSNYIENTNIWHMATLILSQGVLKFFIDGIDQGSCTSMNNSSPNSSITYFGRQSAGTSENVNGKLDDIGIWNRALTECEIKSLFNSGPWLAINDISICLNDTGTLIAQTVENGGAFQWSSGQQTSSINVSVPTTTSYSVAYTLNGLTCTDSANVTVIPNQTAFFPSVNPICEGDPLSPLPTSSLNLFQGTWSPPLNNLLTTTYTFTPSPNVCVWDTTTLTIVVKPIPLLSSQDISVCKGQPLTVTSVPNIPNGAFAWSNNTTSNQFVVTADSSTFFTATYTVDGCTSEADTVTIFVYQLPVASITPSGPTTFCAESSVQISSSYTYGNAWNTNETSSSITVSSSGNYDLIVTDSNGCVDSATIFITNTGITCIQIGGVFTPNGDGTNDTWEIPGIENYPDATVEIFNRWGQQIFYSNGYNSPWNGTYNNEPLPTGDYFYIIDLGNDNPVKGALTIKN